MTIGKDFTIDVFCIGVPRSRSTWLKSVLDAHTGIYIPHVKEANFFVKTVNLYTSETNLRYLSDWQWYKSLYCGASNGQLKADFSVNMLFNKHDSARLVRKYFPEAKFIVVLRNPMDRTYSHYWLDLLADIHSIVPRTFEEALWSSRLIECSRYYEQLTCWLEHFEKEQFYFMFDFDLDKNANAVLNDLCLFLGIEQYVCEVNSDKVNGCFSYRGVYRSVLKMASIARRLGLGSVIDFVGKSGLWYMMDKVGKVSFQYPSMNPDTRKRLKESLMPDIENLEKLLCKDLSAWKL